LNNKVVDTTTSTATAAPIAKAKFAEATALSVKFQTAEIGEVIEHLRSAKGE
jgi:hypothetical protein